MDSTKSVANPDWPPGRAKSTPPKSDESEDQQQLIDTPDVTEGGVQSHLHSVEGVNPSAETLQRLESLLFASPSGHVDDQSRTLSPSKHRHSARRRGGVYNINIDMANSFAELYYDVEETPRARIVDSTHTSTALRSSFKSQDSWTSSPDKRLTAISDIKRDAEKAEEYLRNHDQAEQMPDSTTQSRPVFTEQHTSDHGDHGDEPSVDSWDLGEVISGQSSSCRPMTPQSSDLETSDVPVTHIAFNKGLPRPARGESKASTMQPSTSEEIAYHLVRSRRLCYSGEGR